MIRNCSIHRLPLRELAAVRNDDDFHRFLIEQAVSRYARIVGDDDWGSVLGVCCQALEGRFLPQYPFEEIVLTGLKDKQEEVFHSSEGDPRVSYRQENAECLPFETGAFDLVFCKAGLHHLPRPMLGLYEMLRVCRRAVIFIEPHDTFLAGWLQAAGLSRSIETNQRGNLVGRDNYVFRFSRPMLEQVLNSYYLQSGWRMEMHVGWMTWKLCVHENPWLRWMNLTAGAALSFLPGAGGNLVTAIIVPGKNRPPAARRLAALPPPKGRQTPAPLDLSCPPETRWSTGPVQGCMK